MGITNIPKKTYHIIYYMSTFYFRQKAICIFDQNHKGPPLHTISLLLSTIILNV